MDLVSNAKLIEGIEDIGGVERVAIARAVPVEAAMMAQALFAAGVQTRHTIKHPSHSPTQDYEAFKVGWYLGPLPDGAPYAKGDGTIGREDGAVAMLGVDGGIYAYSPHTDQSSDGLMLNRYAPVCATSMNDRTMLLGIAVKAAAHDLEVPPTS